MKKILSVTLCIVITLVTLTSCGGTEKPLTTAEILDLGEKYLLEQNYAQALVQFLAVIEVEPMDPRGYIGAADAYVGLGDLEKAVEVLQQGLGALLGNAEIEAKLREVEGMLSMLNATPTPAPTPAPTPTPTSTPTPTLTTTPMPEPTRISDSGHEIIEFGGYDWRVLEVKDGIALIISDKAIESWAYHSERVSVTWASSDLRAYLNGEFYNSFNMEDRAKIVQVYNSNPDNQWYGTDGGADTQDSIFLLSLDELVEYFGDSGKYAEGPGEITSGPYQYTNNYGGGTVYTYYKWERYWIDDEYNGNRIAYHAGGTYTYDGEQYTATEGEPGWWWLRSPGFLGLYATSVDRNGLVSVSGLGVDILFRGVRPALWLKLDGG